MSGKSNKKGKPDESRRLYRYNGDGTFDKTDEFAPKDYAMPKGTQYVYVNVYEKSYVPYAYKSCAEAIAQHVDKFNNVYLGVVKLPLEYAHVQ